MSPQSSESRSGTEVALATIVFTLLLFGFWEEVHTTRVVAALGGHIPSAFLSFALLLMVLWFFAFGVAEYLRDHVRLRVTRLVAPALLAIPYFVFAIPRGELQWSYGITLTLIPVALSAVIEFSILEQKFAWQDLVVLLATALILETRLLSGAWPYLGLGSFPKIYLADVVLYVYLVVRRLEGVGYSFVPSTSAFNIGLREWIFFAPIGIGLGLMLHFIRFFPRAHSVLEIMGGILVTFLLTAVPEELFFRGVLQNLLEPRLGRSGALLTASVLFGLSHFHKGAMFNWRYVVLASLAGVFYGRAWRARRQLLASATTHTLVDVVWSMWFR